MKYRLCVLLNILFNFLEISKSQYIIVNRKANNLNQCDQNNALVEQFFNIIFTEFHRTPPVCVCVQMCIESPTYCYPNGCLKNLNRRKTEDTTTAAHPVNRIQYDGHNPTKSVMFLVDNDKDLIDNIFNGPKKTSHSEKRENPTSHELIFSPNPFRELVFKYRKVPKLEMRYNLREKIKKSRSDKIKSNKLDMSRTRWSMNKQFYGGKQLLNKIRLYKKDADASRTFFASMFPEIEALSTQQKSLVKREDSSGFNVDALYIYKTHANFSVDKLIDDIIINSLDDNNVNMKMNKRMHFDDKAITTTETSGDIVDGNVSETTVTDNVYETTTVDEILMSSTQPDRNIINHIPHINLTTNNKTYLEEIAIMSEEIEKNNNITIDIINRLTGGRILINKTKNNNYVDVPKTDFDPKTLKESQILKFTTESNKYNVININNVVTKRWLAPVLKNKFNQKSRQRITRKLNQKVN
ncbi:uncharacterized protein LOC113392722 [Vanessa tameamea]|uniref:Uncharacterized protein LOC113392722 n=1 Tax=Vanessa tameamea TaxID=334116 RepID=A0ABM4AZZ1_VANTA